MKWWHLGFIVAWRVQFNVQLTIPKPQLAQGIDKVADTVFAKHKAATIGIAGDAGFDEHRFDFGAVADELAMREAWRRRPR